MKSCPNCNRTFEDTFTFCLIDGAVLSAPLDLEAGKAVPPQGDSIPPRTEILTGASELASLPQTQAAPRQNFQPTITAPPPATPQLPTDDSTSSVAAKRSVLPKVLIAVAVVLVVAVLGAGVLWVLSKSGKRNNPEVDVSIKTPVDSSSSSATELRIRIRHNACDRAFYVSWSVDRGPTQSRGFYQPAEEHLITAKQSFSLSNLGNADSWEHKCIDLFINGRRATLPTDSDVLITTDNYQQFLE